MKAPGSEQIISPNFNEQKTQSRFEGKVSKWLQQEVRKTGKHKGNCVKEFCLRKSACEQVSFGFILFGDKLAERHNLHRSGNRDFHFLLSSSFLEVGVVVVAVKCYEIRKTESAAPATLEAIMPVEKRGRGSLAAVILLITVGLAGKVSAWNNGRARVEVEEPSAAQRYFDAVAPEDKETFIKYYLDKALEERIPGHTSLTQADFSFVNFQEPVEPPPDFAANLLNHFETSFDMTEQDVYDFVRYVMICFPNGYCFDPDDVGNICCPF